MNEPPYLLVIMLGFLAILAGITTDTTLITVIGTIILGAGMAAWALNDEPPRKAP